MSNIQGRDRTPKKVRPAGVRFWVEIVLATASAVAFVGTLVDHEWIEKFFHVDPDHGSGSLEWLIVIALGALAVLFSALAGRTWVLSRGLEGISRS